MLWPRERRPGGAAGSLAHLDRPTGVVHTAWAMETNGRPATIAIT